MRNQPICGIIAVPTTIRPFRTACDLDAFVVQAALLNQHNRDPCTTPFPKAPGRWLSHDAFTPHPIELTLQGDVDGGRSWRIGVTLDCSVTRSLCVPSYGNRGGSCDDPASPVMREVAATVDQYVEYAPCCGHLHDRDKGRRARQRAGLYDQVPGEEALCTFRYRIGDAVIDQIMAVAVDFLSH